MSKFYIKNGDKYLPVDIKKTFFTKELENHLVIVKVGDEECQVDSNGLDVTEESFIQADVLSNLKNTSVIITPYQIEVDVISQKEAENKQVCLQITSGNDMSMLSKHLREMYNKLKNKFDLVILPSPLKVGEFRKVKDILKRSKLRRDRRYKTKI